MGSAVARVTESAYSSLPPSSVQNWAGSAPSCIPGRNPNYGEVICGKLWEMVGTSRYSKIYRNLDISYSEDGFVSQKNSVLTDFSTYGSYF